jgi:hypothetical protein
MPALIISMAGEEGFPAIKDHQRVVYLGEAGQVIRVAPVDGGMASGRPSVVIRLDLADGMVVIAPTSARLFCTAAKAIMAKYPDLFEGD